MTPRVMKAIFAIALALGALGPSAGAVASTDRALVIVQALISTLAVRSMLEHKGYT